MKLWSKIILLLLIPQLCYAQMMVQNRDIKQPPETKLFISSNSPLIKDYATAKTLSVNGNTTISTNQIKTGKNSIYFDGSGDYLSIANNTDFNFETGDFTVDFWSYNTDSATRTYVFTLKETSKYSTLKIFYPSGSNDVIYCGSDSAPGLYNILNGTTLGATVTNGWTHIALVRSGNNFYSFRDGVIKNTTVSSATMPAGVYATNIGGYTTGSLYFKGYLQDLRVFKGKALWTSNFTPPRRSGAF